MEFAGKFCHSVRLYRPVPSPVHECRKVLVRPLFQDVVTPVWDIILVTVSNALEKAPEVRC